MCLYFYWEKEQYCVSSSHFLAKYCNGIDYMLICNIYISLTNDIVSFEQLGSRGLSVYWNRPSVKVAKHMEVYTLMPLNFPSILFLLSLVWLFRAPAQSVHGMFFKTKNRFSLIIVMSDDLLFVGWLVVLGLTALWDSISVYIGPSPRERRKKKRNDKWEKKISVQTTPNPHLLKARRPLPN